MRSLGHILLAMVTLVGAVSCAPPPVAYPYYPKISQKRATLKDNLLQLLPDAQQAQPAAQVEAQWLADTAYKAAAGVSRINGSYFPGWAGNALINAYLQDRGLCWHYQQDLFRELRRRPLRFFRIGCCVRDMNKLAEHNCVYIAASDAQWPRAWVLDAWMWNGRLKVDLASTLDQDDWDDSPTTTTRLQLVYPEGHGYPIEHWLSIRCYNGKYGSFYTEVAQKSSQYRRMYENIQRGKTEHPGSLINY